MPVDPGAGESFAARVTGVVADAELALLRLLAEALVAGESGDWVQAKLTRLQLLRAAITTGARGLDQAAVAEVEQVVLEAYNVGQGLALTELDAAGVTPAAAATPAASAASVAAPAVEAARQATRRLPDALTGVYRQAVEAGAAEVLGGDVTRLQAAQHVLDRLTSDGVTGYVDRAGRRWSLTSYTEMAVRTSAGQAAVKGHTDSLQAAGLDLVVVSDAPRECPLCRPWEGKILSLSGATRGSIITRSLTSDSSVRVTVAGSFADAKAAGFQHPNCRHSVSAYLPGATHRETPKRDPAGYEATQRQRALERKVREWKRREAVALTPEAAARARSKTREWQAAIREHVDVNDLKRLSRREQIGKAT